MKGTEFSSGGSCEYDVSVHLLRLRHGWTKLTRCSMQLQGFNGLWLTLLEVKQRLMGNIGNSLAQLMAQVAGLFMLLLWRRGADMLSLVAHAANKKFQHPQLTVYGVLTDQTMFYFISYDGIEFTGYPRLSLSPNKLQFLRGMMARKCRTSLSQCLYLCLSSFQCFVRISVAGLYCFIECPSEGLSTQRR